MNKTLTYFGFQRSPQTDYFAFERVQIGAQCQTLSIGIEKAPA